MGKKTSAKYISRAGRGWKGMTTSEPPLGVGPQGITPDSLATTAKKQKTRKKAAQSRKRNRRQR